MILGPIKQINARALPMPGNDIDTDRIIPARFLRSITFEGLGDNAFIDERVDEKHPMNNKNYNGSKIILTGNNFGCGSSREHAPQAIKRAGYEAIIAESFAEIFYGNSSMLGLVCVTLPKEDIDAISAAVAAKPDTVIDIDIVKKTVTAAGKVYNISIKDTLRTALINGTYDTLAELLKNKEEVAEFNKNLPPFKYA